MTVNSKKQSQTRVFTPRNIYINDTLLELLKKQEKITGNKVWIFLNSRNDGPLQGDTLGVTLARLVKGTKFEGVAFHALRRSYSSILASKSTATSRVIEKIMGHENSDMKIIYQHALPESIETAMKQVELT